MNFLAARRVGLALDRRIQVLDGLDTEQGEVLGTSIGGLLGRWVHVAAVFYNGVPTASQNALYIDGVRQTLTACEGGPPTSRSAGGNISWGSNNGYELDGLLDEGRIARGPRTATWIATEFANQREPAVFLRAGPEETAPP